MGHKPYYKNIKTGNYGVLEGGTVSMTKGQHNAYLSFRLFEAVGGMVEQSSAEERVLAIDLVEVSPEEVQKALLGF
ncbi:MAG: hypothetical protein V7L21_13170 [Nostoc sp.]|uniref:hypothetical protein n=1 Tax=Nostoc sp. TaxID=1180 RepID=UPI002FF7CDBA